MHVQLAVQTLKFFLSRIGLYKDCKGLLLNLERKEEGECLSFAHAHRDGEERLDTKKQVLPNIHNISFLLCSADHACPYNPCK